MKRLLITLIFGLLPLALLGQRAELRGLLLDSTGGKPVGYALVQVLNPQDSSLLGGAAADSLGRFVVTQLPEGSALVSIEALGYEPWVRLVNIPKGGEDLGQIPLVVSEQLIEEVRVTGQAPEVILKAGRKEMRLPEGDVKMGVPLTELLARTPDFDIDGEGNLLLRGKRFNVLVDGRTSHVGATQLNLIDPKTIASIEVVTNPSAAFRSTTAGGYINIKRKPRERPGVNGVIQALGGLSNFYRGSASLNVNFGKVNLFLTGDGFYKGIKSAFSVRQWDGKQGPLLYEHVTKGSTNGYSYQPCIGIEVNPNETNFIGINYTYHGQGDPFTNTEIERISPFVPDPIWQATLRRVNKRSTNAVTLLYGHFFPAMQAQLEAKVNGNHTASLDSINSDKGLGHWTRLPHTMALESEVRYTQMLKIPLLLNTGVTYDFMTLRLMHRSWDSPLGSLALSQALEGGMNTHLVGLFLMGEYMLSQQLTLNAGARYEYYNRLVKSEGDTRISEGNFYGSAGVVYHPWKWFGVSASYSGKSERPDPGVYLMPRMTTGVLAEYWVPNPLLRTAYLHKAELSLQQNFGDILSISEDVAYTYTDFPIYITTRPTGTNQWVRTTENARLSHSVDGRLNITSKPASWVRIAARGTLTGYTFAGNTESRVPPMQLTWSVRGDLTFYILKQLRFNVLANYVAPRWSYTRYIDWYCNLSAYLYYTPIPSLSIALTADNLLDMVYGRYYTQEASRWTEWNFGSFPRSYYLSVLWRFGKSFRSRSGINLNTRQKVDYR